MPTKGKDQKNLEKFIEDDSPEFELSHILKDSTDEIEANFDY